MANFFSNTRRRRLVAALVTSIVAGFFGFAHYGFADPQPPTIPVATVEVTAEVNARSSLAQMQRAIAHQLAGDDQHARSLRSHAAHSWVLELDATQSADISVTHLESGRLYRAVFNHDGDDLGLSAVWLSIPNGRGMPSAIVIRNHNHRAGWLALKERSPVAPLYVVETVTCQSKTIIAESRTPFPPNALQSLAKARAVKAMKNPESVTLLKGECANLSRMLPLSSVRQTASLK